MLALEDYSPLATVGLAQRYNMVSYIEPRKARPVCAVSLPKAIDIFAWLVCTARMACKPLFLKGFFHCQAKKACDKNVSAIILSDIIECCCILLFKLAVSFS
jgi:hypothetical protein